MKWFLTPIALAVVCLSLRGQCPDFALTTVSEQCIGLLWLDEQPALPDVIYAGEIPYEEFLGYEGPPFGIAVYSLDGMADEDPTVCIDFPVLFSGLLFVNGEACEFANGVLPIELVSFVVHQAENRVRIEWVTAFEFETKEFIVERSNNGREWTTVDIKPGSRYSDKITSYTSVDNFPLEGTSYYRLRTVDYDGRSEEASIITVNFKSEQVIYPNPATTHLTVRGRFDLIDNLGRHITSGEDETLDVSNLPRGMYIVRSGQQVSRVVLQ